MLRQIMEATPHAMFLIGDDGVITVANAATERLFGHPRVDLLSMAVDELVPERFRPVHSPVGEGRDLLACHASGREFPIQITLSPVGFTGGVQTLASVVDMTERTLAHERLTTIVESAPNAMVMVDAAGLIVQVNSETEKLFGYTRAELVSMDVEVLLPERLRAEHHDLRSVFAERPEQRDIGEGRDLFGRRQDGSEFPVEIGLTPLVVREEQHVLASILDISERLQIQAVQTAKHADILRRSILDSLPFSIIASERDGTIVTANPAAERLLGFDRDELVGRHVSSGA